MKCIRQFPQWHRACTRPTGACRRGVPCRVQRPEPRSKAWAEKYRPQYDELFATIASWRDGRPTVLRTVDKYSDWLGWEDAHLTPDQEKRTVFVHDDWNKMICESADAHGFECADIYHDFNGKDGTKPSGDLLAQDYTHPSDSGNESIARVLIDQGFEPLT
jgi:hypothetical protein